jgi:5-methylcytosine-specific restriction enzyme subunit McrC
VTHHTVREWGRVPVGRDGIFSRGQADALLEAARRHPCGGVEGTSILSDHHRHLTARQVVGVIAGQGCSLEILPKVDPAGADEAAGTVRGRLVHMLDVALGVGLSVGDATSMAHEAQSLLDLFIAQFADRLLAEVRHGLPRQYRAQEEDLRALRGRLDVVRQFTIHAVRPDRLACRFDMLDADTPLLRIMKACVVLLARYARAQETRRKLAELRFLLADVRDVARRDLPWAKVRIDRANGRWRTLLALAKLLLGQHWQQTHADARQPEGITLLFPMHELFERYVTVQARRALAPLGLEVVAQGGFENCLGEWRSGEVCRGRVFRTRPDILVRRHGKVLAVVDTKWKALSADPLDRRHSVSQADIYQLMAYARLYRCDRLLLLYPAPHGDISGKVHTHGMAQGHERLDIATISLEGGGGSTQQRLRELICFHASNGMHAQPKESGAFLGAF